MNHRILLNDFRYLKAIDPSLAAEIARWRRTVLDLDRAADECQRAVETAAAGAVAADITAVLDRAWHRARTDRDHAVHHLEQLIAHARQDRTDLHADGSDA